MRHGFIKVASATPLIQVADCRYNSEKLLNLIAKAHEEGVHLLVLPELCITGSTCKDLFLQQTLLDSARDSVLSVSKNVPKNMVVVFGSPLELSGRVYDCAVVTSGGKIIGIVPLNSKNNKIFSKAPVCGFEADFGDYVVPVSSNLIFSCNQMQSFRFVIENGDDLFSFTGSACNLSREADIVVNLSSLNSYSGYGQGIASTAVSKSAFLKCIYVLAGAGEGESTTDCVYTAQNLICENGICLASQSMKEDELLISEPDVQRIDFIRRNSTSDETAFDCKTVHFETEIGETQLTRKVSKNPFLPSDSKFQRTECEKIFTLQALGLKKRIVHTHCKKVVIGISGGLDSTLALLVSVKVFDMLSMDRSGIVCVTMPCFGTTENTKNNAVSLVEDLGCTLEEIDITDSVLQHFKDISQDENQYDTTYENSQARERTQVLMDIANRENGIVVGTGDLSELALGWATYNGDHMSMYAVNASVPKTVIRAIVNWYASVADNENLRNVLYSILETPVSPELIPGSQHTEDIVGPYELHDFFIWYILKCGCTPSKVFRLARYVFSDDYSDETIMKWLKTFCRRFFSQQFKRSCMPDGPQVTSVSLSPRGVWEMPSDASFIEWKNELEDSLI